LRLDEKSPRFERTIAFIGLVARIANSKWNYTKEGWKDWTKSEKSFLLWFDSSLPEMGIHFLNKAGGGALMVSGLHRLHDQGSEGREEH
jgi:hypothetical protein